MGAPKSAVFMTFSVVDATDIHVGICSWYGSMVDLEAFQRESLRSRNAYTKLGEGRTKLAPRTGTFAFQECSTQNTVTNLDLIAFVPLNTMDTLEAGII